MRKVLSIMLLVAVFISCIPSAIADENTNYWLTDEKKTITIFLSHDYQTDFNESNLLYQKLEELTNVHVEWKIVSSSDYETKKSLNWASGDMPDIIYGTNNDEVLTYSALGALLPFDEYKEYIVRTVDSHAS